jgi:two-component system, OmpR family, phosphate regulon sensor histidine kinase PhoR
MLLNPRLIALLLAFFIASVTIMFLNFVPNANLSHLFVAGLVSFSMSFFVIFYAIDVLVYKEVLKMQETIRRLKPTNTELNEKDLVKNSNPFKKLNQEIAVYVTKQQREIDNLKKLEIFRREFLADVSHELKTPIFAAQGFIHTLIDGAVEDAQVRDKFLSKAAKSLDGLEALVKDLVVISQMEMGEVKMNMEIIDLRATVLDVCEQLEKKATQRHIVIKVKPDKASEIRVKADAYRIGQVMTNLIENAIKYGREYGKVNITLDEDKKFVTISVQDDGPGIASEYLNRIFERFFRVDKSRSRDTGGTGLGLAIVKHILNAHGTQIVVASGLDKGSVFSFTLQKQ